MDGSSLNKIITNKTDASKTPIDPGEEGTELPKATAVANRNATRIDTSNSINFAAK